MRHKLSQSVALGPTISRRAWLGGVLGGLVTVATKADDDREGRETREAEARAQELGLKSFRSLKSKHYAAVGNASDDYLRITLLDCEAIARDFIEHYSSKGFPVAFPHDRMTAVVLEDERAFAQFLPERKNSTQTGVYLPGWNWLVVQDFRRVPRFRTDIPVWADNLRTLAHEATHQLTFNTGLLNREGDVPRCIGEGLATYGEVRRPNARSLPGQINHSRLTNLAHYRRGLGWIPLSRLLVDESWWNSRDGAKVLLSYAQSWLLIHYLMSEPNRTAQFRKYLEAIDDRKASDLRIDDARANLGDLEKLDEELKKYSVRLLQGG